MKILDPRLNGSESFGFKAIWQKTHPHQFLLPISGIINLRLKKKVNLNQGTIHAFSAIKLSY